MFLAIQDQIGDLDGRGPHGPRGLKFRQQVGVSDDCLSRPARAAWIEMITAVGNLSQLSVAARTGRVD